MTNLKGFSLHLDLKHDQVARDVAFTYAMNIMPKEPKLADSILSVVEANDDIHRTKQVTS